MVNDLPDPNNMALLPAVFADDYAAWMAGKNLKYLCSNVQKHLDDIIK